MGLEGISEKGKNKVSDTTTNNKKDFTRINSEKLVLDPRREFLKGGRRVFDADHAKWERKYAGKDLEDIHKVIDSNGINLAWCSDLRHINQPNDTATLEKLTHYRKKRNWLIAKKRQLEGSA